MDLSQIGFYTLSDERAKACSSTKNLHRCELILTDSCNFNCSYCRGVQEQYRKSLPLEKAKFIVSEWQKHGLKNIRFSGGEPTLYSGLFELVDQCHNTCEHIALSTNGSAPFFQYERLMEYGVNDMSISLDACCSSTGDTMCGKKGEWDKVIKNIEKIAKYTYTTVGVVLTENNLKELGEIIILADQLGVSDIRIIPAAQYAKQFDELVIPDRILAKYPILKYRYENFKNGLPIRGLKETDNHQCPLVLDDMAVIGNHHYPCIIYLREQGKPIGDFTNIESVRKQRYVWFKHHDVFKDDICRNNCLDACVCLNNKIKSCHKEVI